MQRIMRGDGLRQPQRIEEGCGGQNSGKILWILVPVADPRGFTVPTVELVEVWCFDPCSRAINEYLISTRWASPLATTMGWRSRPQQIIAAIYRPLSPRIIWIFHDQIRRENPMRPSGGHF